MIFHSHTALTAAGLIDGNCFIKYKMCVTFFGQFSLFFERKFSKQVNDLCNAHVKNLIQNSNKS